MVKPKLEIVDDPTALETIFYILKGNSYAQDIAKNAEKDPKTYSRKIEQLAKKRIINLETGFEHNKKVATINYKELLRVMSKLKLSELEEYQRKLQIISSKITKDEKHLLAFLEIEKDVNKLKQFFDRLMEEIDKKEALKEFLREFIVKYCELSNNPTLRAMIRDMSESSVAISLLITIKSMGKTKFDNDVLDLLNLFGFVRTMNPALLATLNALKI